MLELTPYNPEELKRFAQEASAYVRRCWVRGFEEAVPQGRA
jgi:hypothetical protein